MLKNLNFSGHIHVVPRLHAENASDWIGLHKLSSRAWEAPHLACPDARGAGGFSGRLTETAGETPAPPLFTLR